MKTLLLTPLILLAILYPYQPSSNTANATTENTTAENVTANTTWQLGDDITPLPLADFQDCDDETLYSFYWLTYTGYNPTILTGLWYNPEKLRIERHVWLRLSDNETSFDYDYGKAWRGETFIDYTGMWAVKDITLYQLVMHVEKDLE